MLNMFKTFIAALQPNMHIALLAHRDPDFDTLSACAALGKIIQSFGCSVELIIPNTEDVTLDYFPFSIQSATYTKKPELLVICDTSNINRVFYPEAFHHIPIALFDHHQGGNITAKFRLVDTTAPSCCDLIADLLHEYNKELITKEIAQLLLDGLVSDTLSFRTSGVLPTTLMRAAYLLEHGAKPMTTHQRLTQKQSPDDFVFKTKLMSHLKVNAAASCAYLLVTEQELLNAHKTKGVLEGVGNEMLSGMFINTTIIVYTMNCGQTKVSMRSNSTNVYELARARGGGGHIPAAGFTSMDTPEKIIANLLAELSTEQKHLKKS